MSRSLRFGLSLVLAAFAMLALYLLVAPLASAGALRLSLLGRDVELLEPRGLYALTLLPVVFWAPTWSLSDLSLFRRVLSALLRALVVSALALALARPAEPFSTRLTSTVFVVDVSSSMSDETLRALEQRVQSAYRARGPHHVELVTFAQDARREPLTDDAPLSIARHAQSNGTDIEGALSLALGLFMPGRLRQVVLFSDGRETHGQLARAERMLQAEGVLLFAEAPSEALPAEAAVRALDVPRSVEVGAPFFVRVVVSATVPMRARVRLYQDDVLNGLDGARDVSLAAGDTELTFRTIARSAGPVTYRAEIEPAVKERFAENNRFERTVLVKGKPRILYVEGVREQGAAFAEALRAGGFEVDVRGATGVPTSEAELSQFDFFVLSNVPRDALPYAAMNAIDAYLSRGGAFMMAGGDDSFGLGGYRGTKLEDLLPVRLDTERRRDQPSLALALVIDKSGSMSGQKIELAKEAARATAELLSAEDYLGVIGFDAEPTRVVRLGTAANRLGIARGIGKLASGGGTAIFPALDAAYSDLASVRARVKHVILLTDGQTHEDGLVVLAQNMQVDSITVSAIGLGADVNRTLLEELARVGHGRAYFTTDPSHIPRLFMKETYAVARSSAVEDYVTARVVSKADFLKSLAIESAPFLRGYVATRARPSPAQVILESDLGEPLLARMRVGLGWSLAWTSDVTPRWSSEWFRWPSFSTFWGQLVREHVQKHEQDELGIEAHAEGDDLVATIDAFDRDERFVNGLSGELTVTHHQGGAALRVPLRQTAPGRYQARAPLTRFGSYVLQGVLSRGGTPVLAASGDFAQPFPLELRELTPAPEPLRAAAERTGGGPAPALGKMFEAHGRKLTFPVERWMWLAWAALFCFVVDVAARRVPSRR